MHVNSLHQDLLCPQQIIAYDAIEQCRIRLQTESRYFDTRPPILAKKMIAGLEKGGFLSKLAFSQTYKYPLNSLNQVWKTWTMFLCDFYFLSNLTIRLQQFNYHAVFEIFNEILFT